ncbi:mRNA surveillance protein pelota [Candidatus Woesearchaeota archaeon]|nr:MAG: mRNA surveillance protein pelota [Candidatus Woesearchaeota archaeon]
MAHSYGASGRGAYSSNLQRFIYKGFSCSTGNMHIIKKDIKRGDVSISVETPDDLWTLKSIISPGDTVRGSTERKIRLGAGKDEKTSVVRRRVTLTITVEKVDYAADGSSLRVLGTIIDGPDDVPRGEHHSFILEPNTQLTISKDWSTYQLRKLEEATKQEQPLIVVLFDREEARLFSVKRRGIQELLRLKGNVAKKGEDGQHITNFYKEIVTELQQRADEHTRIIAGAPAFWREYLEKELPAPLRKRTVFTTISGIERTAIRELLTRPEVAKLIAEHASLRELELVEKALTALANEKLAYGLDFVKEAVSAGNAEQLIVTESALADARQQGTMRELESLMRQCEQNRGAVHVLTSNEARGKIDPLGGVVAIRRW